MSVFTSPKTYVALGAFHAVDAVACGIQVAPIRKVLDDVGVPENVRPVLPVVKAA
ncbi:MAG: DoxX family protein, partial [Mycobacterium sp.]